MKILADPEKHPVDDGIREELRCCLVILTIDMHGNMILDGLCGSIGATKSIVFTGPFHGSLLPAKIGG
jgi:hypothetical protein